MDFKEVKKFIEKHEFEPIGVSPFAKYAEYSHEKGHYICIEERADNPGVLHYVEIQIVDSHKFNREKFAPDAQIAEFAKFFNEILGKWFRNFSLEKFYDANVDYEGVLF